MAITRIQSNVVSAFIQPALEGTVDITCDPGIDWLRVGGYVHVVGGGIYEITDNTMYAWTLKLKTAEAQTGETVMADVIYPVNHNADNEYSWGQKDW